MAGPLSMNLNATSIEAFLNFSDESQYQPFQKSYNRAAFGILLIHSEMDTIQEK